MKTCPSGDSKPALTTEAVTSLNWRKVAPAVADIGINLLQCLWEDIGTHVSGKGRDDEITYRRGYFPVDAACSRTYSTSRWGRNGGKTMTYITKRR